MQRLFNAGLVILAIGSLAGAPARAEVLYDASAGTLPSAQGWATATTFGFTQSVAGGVYSFDSSATVANPVGLNGSFAGSARIGSPVLDTAGGFDLDFNLAVVSESHSRPERGGFSILVTGSDFKEAIEIAFWTDHVFAYTPTFAHGADASFVTTSATDYSLAVANQQYTLSAGGNVLLSGSLVDYSASLFSPYSTSSLIFFGDDTTSARASVQVRDITLTSAVPEPSNVALMAGGLVALGWLRRRRGAPKAH